VFKAEEPLVIISGSEFVSLISLVLSAYFVSNVFQRHVELKHGYNSLADTELQPIVESPEETEIETDESDKDKEA
jgi:hypothetical protein